MTRQDLEALSYVAVFHSCGHWCRYAVWLGERTPEQFRMEMALKRCQTCRRKSVRRCG